MYKLESCIKALSRGFALHCRQSVCPRRQVHMVRVAGGAENWCSDIRSRSAPGSRSASPCASPGARSGAALSLLCAAGTSPRRCSRCQCWDVGPCRSEQTVDLFPSSLLAGKGPQHQAAVTSSAAVEGCEIIDSCFSWRGSAKVIWPEALWLTGRTGRPNPSNFINTNFCMCRLLHVGIDKYA